MKNLVILASGSGSNAERIVEYFKDSTTINVSGIITNNPNAGVIDRAKRLGIRLDLITKSELEQPESQIKLLNQLNADFVILAGYLKKIPQAVISEYSGKILNLHPALLPKYGGKGMYGMNVHRAVIDNKEVTSGITIHLVNEVYDDGPILFQGKCSIDAGDTPETLVSKIHKLEYEHFPKVIEEFVQGNQ
jgi:phosphoribosylglycinamide formyltransferase-1